MSEPTPQLPPEPEPEGDVEVLVTALDATSPDRVGRLLRALQLTIWAVCAPVALTAAAGLTLGVLAWSDSIAVSVIVIAATVPAAVLATYVGVRAGRLADAVTHPGEVLAQARDLASRAKDSPELRQLARSLRRDARPPRSRAGRIRGFVAKGRLVSAVIGLVGPDPVRHRLLVPFTPDRLHNLWMAVIAGLWWWLASAVVALLAALALLVSALGA